MANIITVEGGVVKMEADKNGFIKVNIKGDDGQWHNYIGLTHNGKGIKSMPSSFKVGDRIKISYDKDNYNNATTAPEVLPKQSNNNSGGGYQSKGGKGGYQGKSAGNQDQIMRQSCMGYAATLVASVAKKTAKPEDLAKETVEIAENVLFKYASSGKAGLPEIFGGEEKEAKQEAPAPKPESKSEPTPESQQQEEEFDSDVPF